MFLQKQASVLRVRFRSCGFSLDRLQAHDHLTYLLTDPVRLEPKLKRSSGARDDKEIEEGIN